jgi:hypothetical protein
MGTGRGHRRAERKEIGVIMGKAGVISRADSFLFWKMGHIGNGFPIKRLGGIRLENPLGD